MPNLGVPSNRSLEIKSSAADPGSLRTVKDNTTGADSGAFSYEKNA